jgi:hypothetical protein
MMMFLLLPHRAARVLIRVVVQEARVAEMVGVAALGAVVETTISAVVE